MMDESLETVLDSKTILNAFRQNHPQLTEKGIVDYINGLEVINDQVSFSKQIINGDSFLNKILDSITGKSQQRQLLINKNVATSLEVISVWLQELEFYRIDNDIVITRLIDKLSETRNATMHVNRRVNEIDSRVVELQSKISFEFSRLNERVQRTEAKSHVDLVIAKWNAELWFNYPPLVSLYLCIDELHWGDFGMYCRNSADANKVNDLTDYLRNCLLEIIKKRIGTEKNELFVMAQWLKPISALPDERLEMLTYLCNWADSKTTPITWSIYSYATSYTPTHASKDIPITLNSARLIDRLVDEQSKRVNLNGNY